MTSVCLTDIVLSGWTLHAFQRTCRARVQLGAGIFLTWRERDWSPFSTNFPQHLPLTPLTIGRPGHGASGHHIRATTAGLRGPRFVGDGSTLSLIERLRTRAGIRRQIPGRKSVQEGVPDRLADLLDEAADGLEALELENKLLKMAERKAGAPDRL